MSSILRLHPLLRKMIENICVNRNIYSEDEVIIGVYHDKKLYRKDYPVTINSAGSYEIAKIPDDLDILVDIYGTIALNGKGNNSRPLPMVGQTINNMIRLEISGGTIILILNADWNNYIGHITIEYTKTTEK